MIRKIVSILILVPLAILIVAFAVANRDLVTLSFDPFDTANPAYVAKVPMFILTLVLVFSGVVIGGIAAWLKQSKWRRAARRAEARLRDQEAQNVSLRRRVAELEQRTVMPQAYEPPQLLRLRPPAA